MRTSSKLSRLARSLSPLSLARVWPHSLAGLLWDNAGDTPWSALHRVQLHLRLALHRLARTPATDDARRQQPLDSPLTRSLCAPGIALDTLHTLCYRTNPPSVTRGPLLARDTHMLAPRPVHLVTVLHGLWGSPSHIAYVVDSITRHAARPSAPRSRARDSSPARTTDSKVEVVVLAPRTNAESFAHTYDGIDVCADRVVEEIDAEVRRIEDDGGKVERFSIVGCALCLYRPPSSVRKTHPGANV